MEIFISLLRGVNVSGSNRVRMEDLRALYAGQGLSNVRTYLQSGNVVFESGEPDETTLAGMIETKIRQTLGLEVPVLIRSAAEWAGLLQSNPFLNDRQENPDHLYVTFLRCSPGELDMKNLKPPADEQDEFYLVGREIHLFCPNGYGRTKLSNGWFEHKLKQTATTRNWKTVTALHQMALENRHSS